MNSEAVETTFVSARRLLASGECTEAIELLEAAVADSPDEGTLWCLLGVAQWGIGSVEDSIASLETATTLVPVGAEGRLALALGYEVIQKRELASDLFVGLLSEEHLPYAVLEPLSRALARAKQPALALEVCQRAAGRRPDSAGPLRGMAFYMTQLDRASEEILPVLFKAFHLEPEDFDTRMQLAKRLLDCGRLEEAAYLMSVIEIESSCCPSCLVAMQEIFEAAGDSDNARRCLETLIAIAEKSEGPNDF
ncbi:MAG: tetratricopeptide repeat protein [Planctomycetota bacterium]